MKIVFQPKYSLISAMYIDETGESAVVQQTVTMPNETLVRLHDSEKYPFYRFLDEDGLDIYVQYDAILQIRRVVD